MGEGLEDMSHPFESTYAPRGFPGSGRSSAEYGALETGLRWRCRGPAMQCQQHINNRTTQTKTSNKANGQDMT